MRFRRISPNYAAVCSDSRERNTGRLHRHPLIRHESFTYHESSMKPLSCLWLPAMLGEMTARGTGRAESSMKSKQQPWNNGQAKELPYPEPSLCADSSIKPPASCHSAELSRDYTDPLSAVTLSLLLTLSVCSDRRLHFFSSLSLLSLHFSSPPER